MVSVRHTVHDHRDQPVHRRRGVDRRGHCPVTLGVAGSVQRLRGHRGRRREPQHRTDPRPPPRRARDGETAFHPDYKRDLGAPPGRHRQRVAYFERNFCDSSDAAAGVVVARPSDRLLHDLEWDAVARLISAGRGRWRSCSRTCSATRRSPRTPPARTARRSPTGSGQYAVSCAPTGSPGRRGPDEHRRGVTEVAGGVREPGENQVRRGAGGPRRARPARRGAAPVRRRLTRPVQPAGRSATDRPSTGVAIAFSVYGSDLGCEITEIPMSVYVGRYRHGGSRRTCTRAGTQAVAALAGVDVPPPRHVARR